MCHNILLILQQVRKWYDCLCSHFIQWDINSLAVVDGLLMFAFLAVDKAAPDKLTITVLLYGDLHWDPTPSTAEVTAASGGLRVKLTSPPWHSQRPSGQVTVTEVRGGIEVYQFFPLRGSFGTVWDVGMLVAMELVWVHLTTAAIQPFESRCDLLHFWSTHITCLKEAGWWHTVAPTGWFRLITEGLEHLYCWWDDKMIGCQVAKSNA